MLVRKIKIKGLQGTKQKRFSPSCLSSVEPGSPASEGRGLILPAILPSLSLYAYPQTHIHTHSPTYTHICTCIHMCVHPTYKHACIYTHMHSHVCTCTHVYTCIHTHTPLIFKCILMAKSPDPVKTYALGMLFC